MTNTMPSTGGGPPRSDSRDGPHMKRGRLLNGASPGDPNSSPRCGARTLSGHQCRGPAMWSRRAGRYTRCRFHGGKSCGPRTPDGLERSRKARWKHGRRSEGARTARKQLAWASRFITLLPKLDRLFRLLTEISWNVDSNVRGGLRKKCMAALKLWREYQSVLKTAPGDSSERALRFRPAIEDRLITAMLQAGTLGDAPEEIREKLRSLACDGLFA